MSEQFPLAYGEGSEHEWYLESTQHQGVQMASIWAIQKQRKNTRQKERLKSLGGWRRAGMHAQVSARKILRKTSQ